MEDSTTDTDQEEEEEKGGKAQEDPIYAIAPTINIQDERFVDLSTTPAFICLHEVHIYLCITLFINYYNETCLLTCLKIQMKLISLSK